MGKFLKREASDSLKLSSELVARKTSPVGHEHESIRVTSSGGDSASGDVQSEDILASATGGPPKGEERSLEVANTLLHYLNGRGSAWGPARSPASESGVDAVASGPAGTMQIQVTAVTSNPGFWRDLSKSSAVAISSSAAAAADEIMKSIEKKAARLSTKDIALALDAGRAVGLALEVVVDSFRDRHQLATKAFGFSSVWLVGPVASIVYQLDA